MNTINEINKTTSTNTFIQPTSLTKEEIHALLIELGYDPTKFTNAGDSILHLAAKKNDLDALSLGIAYGLDPAMPNRAGDTPLHVAAQKGFLEICSYLIDHGVPIDWKNSLEQTPFHKALAGNHQEVMDLLYQKGYKPGDEVTDYLISQGYYPSYKDSAGNGILHKAVTEKNLAMVSYLLDHGYAIETQNGSGLTPLMLSASRGDAEMTTLLLSRGANINAVDKHGNTALILATKKQAYPVMKILLESPSVNSNALNAKGISALHYACAKEDIYGATLLLEKGANVNLCTKPEFWQEPEKPLPPDFGDFSFPCRDVPDRPRMKGYLAPLASPLAIAKKLYPNNASLIALLEQKGGTYRYEAELAEKGKSLQDYLK